MSSNILICPPENNVKVVDFEFSSYDLRCLDLVGFLYGWDLKNLESNDWRFPEDSFVAEFVRFYIEKCDHILGRGWAAEPVNRVHSMVDELKKAVLIQMLCTIVCKLKQLESFQQETDTEFVNILVS